MQLALSGLGRWGETLVRAVNGTTAKVRFTTAVTRNSERHGALAREHDLRLVGTLDAALSDPAIDGVVIATPHSLHAEAIAACRAAGKPVLVEKPFTLTRAEAVRALSQGGSLVAAAHNRRFLPAFDALQTALSDLGTILHIEANFSSNVAGRYTDTMWRADTRESPSGGMAGAGIHLIDLIIAIAGPVSSVSALASRRVEGLPIDDTVAALFRLESGASANLTTIMATADCFRLQVFATGGSVELRGQDELVVARLSGETLMETFPPFDIERAELEAFAAAIAGDIPYPVPLTDVLNGISVFEAIGEASKTGRSIVIDPA